MTIEMRFISRLMKKYPIRTQLGLSGLIAWSSDTTVQVLSDRPFDYTRNIRFAATFLLFGGPANLAWLRFLDSRKLNTIHCVACDNLMFYPTLLFCIVSINELLKFYVTNETNQNELPDRMQELPGLVASSWCVWVPVQTVNFTYVPLHYRLIVIQSAAYVFNMYVSYKINK